MPVRLSRLVRFCVNDPAAAAARAGAAAGATADTDQLTGGVNGYGGKPAMRGLGRYYELDVHCQGEPDHTTGYLVNIKDVDRAAREGAVPIVAAACLERPDAEPAEIIHELITPIDERLGGIVAALTWRLTPTYAVTAEKHHMAAVTIRQRFDFAASHRLHVPELSDQQNREIFGKCNNPSGHGHNYQIEPVVEVKLGEDRRSRFSLAQLEAVTDEHVVERFDHKNLNTDTSEFGAPAGVNPSVEHIAAVCYELLAEPIRRASEGAAKLASVTVWETDRTSSTYSGEAAAATTR
jgi:6-pyruvoyltetrahydropterin/6-carboxytetrahydropterin synthase